MSMREMAMNAYEEIGTEVLGTEALGATKKEKQIVGLLSIMARSYAREKGIVSKSVLIDPQDLKVQFVDSLEKVVGEMKVTTADMAKPEKWYESLSIEGKPQR